MSETGDLLKRDTCLFHKEKVVPNVDSVEMFVVAPELHKDLIVEVVHVSGDEDVDIPHNLQYVKSLLKCLWWQVVLYSLSVESVTMPIMHSFCKHDFHIKTVY